MPRYSSTWDVDKVLLWIESNWPDNSTLSLKFLSLKTAMLLALSRPTRASELASLDPLSISDSSAGITIGFSRLMKNQKRGQLRTFELSRSDRPSICVVSSLRMYLSKTASLRVSDSQKTALFVSFQKPHHVVSTATLSRWLVSVLSLAGIDTNTFRGHSTRAAVATHSLRTGMSVQQVLNSAFWSQTSTLRRFYDKR